MQILIRLAAFLAGTCLLGAMAYVSFAPKGADLPLLPALASDKVNHITGCYVLTLLILAALPGLRPSLLAALIVLAGGVVEAAQAEVGREASLSDFLANLAGVLAAVLPIWLARLRSRPPP
ncbi:MAG: hypothetical protein ACO33A_12060 [Hyphomonas sp.]